MEYHNEHVNIAVNTTLSIGSSVTVASTDDENESGRPHHNEQQVHALELCFDYDAFPDDRQREEIAQTLGLTASQVKYWFQNKRTQIKRKKEQAEREALQRNNELLKVRNAFLKASLVNTLCCECRTVKELELENEMLKEELNRVKTLRFNYLRAKNPDMDFYTAYTEAFGETHPPSNF